MKIKQNATADYIYALKRKLGASSDEELALALNVGKSTVASWRLRDSVPAKMRKKILADSGLDVNDFVRDFEVTVDRSNTIFEASMFLAILKLGKELQTDPEFLDYAIWLANSRIEIEMMLIEVMQLGKTNKRPLDYGYLLTRVHDGMLATPNEIIGRREADRRNAKARDKPRNP